MGLTATLMCLYIAFVILISVDTTQGKAELNVVACSVLAGIVHFFTLSSLCWMAVESYNMYLMFVKVINSYIPNLVIKATAFAWGKFEYHEIWQTSYLSSYIFAFLLCV